MTSINPLGASRGHGQLERGLDSSPRSRLFMGRFGRMFRSLPPAQFSDPALTALASAMIANPESELTPETAIDDEENYGLPAGYTYFGQFVDHDITFDPLSSLSKQNDPEGLTDFRTPALDLDGMYGRGPDDQPYLYDPEGRKFLLGDRALTGSHVFGGPVVALTLDLPRFRGRAIIGDKRNDENVIVSQLHGLFMRFHNLLADTYRDLSFSEIQRIVCWHYQWLVLFDYLPRIIGRSMIERILPHVAKQSNIYDDRPRLNFYHPHADPFMPVEFSGAVYRFGHTMVRPVYRLSGVDFKSGLKLKGLDGRKAIFAPNPDDGLNGFHEFDPRNGIDWHLFFETRGHLLAAKSLGRSRVQPAYKIDSSLVNPLGFLPEFSRSGSNKPTGAVHTNSLAFRNLKRGVALQLPSGQSIARFMGLEPLGDEQLMVGKANADGLATNPSILAVDASFAGKAPLWYYILAEAQAGWRTAAGQQANDAARNAQPTILGPVGGRIVGEVLIGLLLGDRDSFLSMEPGWQPLFGDPHSVSVYDRFTIGDLFEVVNK